MGLFVSSIRFPSPDNVTYCLFIYWATHKLWHTRADSHESSTFETAHIPSLQISRILWNYCNKWMHWNIITSKCLCWLAFAVAAIAASWQKTIVRIVSWACGSLRKLDIHWLSTFRAFVFIFVFFQECNFWVVLQSFCLKLINVRFHSFWHSNTFPYPGEGRVKISQPLSLSLFFLCILSFTLIRITYVYQLPIVNKFH